jgi:uncharacterized protein YndB with AHSA1/START domain
MMPMADHELVVTRVFAARRELVFRAWTEPRHVVRWWGPIDCPAEHIELNLRPGGAWRARMRAAADGRELRPSGVFREVVAPERLVFTFAWDEPGERGQETLVTVTFAVSGTGTLVTLHQTPFRSLAERDGHIYGWSSTFDRLALDLSTAGTTESP